MFEPVSHRGWRNHHGPDIFTPVIIALVNDEALEYENGWVVRILQGKECHTCSLAGAAVRRQNLMVAKLSRFRL
jgi:hypothetical protein